VIPPWVAALPWVLAPCWYLWRLRDSRQVTEYPAVPPADPPCVSVVVPARNEAHNIERCVTSLLASAWPAFEVIVVDDHSTDGTGGLARAIAARDPRVRVVPAPELPAGWFGKQWACHTGRAHATGTLLLFTDADTWHAPDALPRAVHALAARGADLLSLAGTQEVHTFWEVVVQPVVFVQILGVFGGTEAMSRSTDPRRKIANGQYLLCHAATYDALGGHAAVREFVAEDLLLAQRWTAARRAVHLLVGLDQLRTRMYRGLGDLARGWGKNIYAGGRHAMPPWLARSGVLRVLMPVPGLVALAPTLAIALAAVGAAPPWYGAAGGIAYAANVVWWAVVCALTRVPLWMAPLHPLGWLVTTGISTWAALRGDRTEWKGREYRAA
jgi:chlorobactene glucosyltransferase